MDGTRTVDLPEELCRAAEHKFGHRFASLDEMLAEMLRHLLRENALTMDQNEQHIIEERLKDLGYI